MQTNAAESLSEPASEVVRLRRARNDDRDGIVSLHVEGLEEVGVGHDPKLDCDLEDIQGSYLARGGEFLVGIDGDRVIAMGAFRKLDSRNAELRRLRVSKSHLRKGFGRALVRQLVEESTARGFKSLVLDAAGEMVAARQLFEAEGFELERQGEFFGLETYFYRKTLTGIPGSAQL
jgi:ribosomal protein S18 acetylase RimI-like enzyme